MLYGGDMRLGRLRRDRLAGRLINFRLMHSTAHRLVNLEELKAFYSRLVARKDRLRVFALPIGVGAAFCIAGLMFPDQLTRYFWYALPIALVAIGIFGYGLMQVSEDLREQRAINKRLSELQAQYGVAEGLAVMGS